jgi:5'-nucleotidase
MNSNERPTIVITNDDGIYADGLAHLFKAASRLGEAIIVAPASEQSAVGHAITLYDPIRVHEIKRGGAFYGYGVTGTPADAVKIAIHKLLPKPPDLVISGINDGANLGVNVLYSGTVSAATEAAILGVPGMAVSFVQKKNPRFEWAVPHVVRIGEWILENGLPAGVAISVNTPALAPDEIKGYRLTRQSVRTMRETFEQREDPRGNVYYWLTGEASPSDSAHDIDVAAINEGYVSITPLHFDLTAHSQFSGIRKSMETLLGS